MEIEGSPSSDQQPRSAAAGQEAPQEAEPDWSALCLSPPPSDAAAAKTTTATNEELQVMAREYFAATLSGQKKNGGDATGTDHDGSSSSDGRSPSEMLSALVVSLEPVLGGTSDDDDGGDDDTSQPKPEAQQQQSANINKRRGAIKPKVRALHILRGAIEGCSSSGDDDDDAGGGLAPAVVSLLGQFLASYCLPYEQDYTVIDPDDDDGGGGDVAMGGMDDNGDDVGEAVRDAAIAAVAALASAQCQPTSLEPAVESSPRADAVCRLLLQRLHLTQKAVECRCLSDDMTDYEHRYIDHGYGDAGADRHDAALEGLGTLPRARRSLCFSALDGAVAGCEAVLAVAGAAIARSSMIQELKRDVNKFVVFVATCLHGETDPRCLRQMLHLLHRCQVVFLPLFALDCGGNAAVDADAGDCGNGDMDIDGTSPKCGRGDDEAFPTVSIFDSVAPYYPIKFTPPPNDPYGITRDGLRDALMAIMCVTEEKKQPTEDKGDGDGAANENMTSLSAKLFMERLVPPKSLDPYGEDYDDDGGETTMDKIEALQDLRDIFLLNSGGSTSGHPLSTVDSGFIKELSSVLVKIHGDAIMNISATPNAGEREKYKSLLEKCREFVANIAEQVEGLGGGVAPSLWEAFVLDTVRDMASVLTTAPQGLKGRSSTAYISSLAACGGIRTLRTCLDGCLPPLIGALQDSGGDEEKAAAAALAAGTLFSSSGKTLTKSSADGIAVHPHPLQQYASDVVRALIALRKNCQQESLRIAAINSLGATLLVVPSSILGTLTSSILSVEGDDVKLILQELLSLASEVVLATDQGEGADLALARSRVVGSALGRGLASKSDRDCVPCVLDDNDVVVDAIIKSIFPDIIESATTNKERDDKSKSERYDLVALTNACDVGGKDASKTIISELLSAILSKLNDDSDNEATEYSQHPAVTPALALSYVVKKGGDLPASVFHSLPSSQVTPFDIIEALSSSKDGEDQQRQVGMSKLLLPTEVEKERNVARDKIDLANDILPHIIPAYKKVAVPTSHLDRFVSSVTKVLPPLSQKDNIRLSVMLPIVAAILGNTQMRTKVDNMDALLLNQLEEMASPIADYALCSEWDRKARSAASSCLFQILLYYQQDKAKCISSSVLKESISPSVADALDQDFGRMADENEKEKSSEAIKGSLEVLAVVGSAAACRGGVSSVTSDAVARFLVDVACKNEATIPLTDQKISPREEMSGNRIAGRSLSASAASSFGMMLSVQNGGPFWRQRMIQIALPLVLDASKASSTSTVSAVSGPPMGPLIAASHIVCCTPMVVIGEKGAQELINMIARGFVEFANSRTLDDGDSSSPPKHFKGWNDLMTGLLASMLKLLGSNSDAMLPYVAGLIPNFLVVCSASSQADDIPSQLLALQCLVAVTHLPSAKRICKAQKVTVTSGLGELMDHPSVILRRAAVHARNVWFMLE